MILAIDPNFQRNIQVEHGPDNGWVHQISHDRFPNGFLNSPKIQWKNVK